MASRRLAPGFRIGASFRARFSPDGSLLATLGKRITLWDVGHRRRIATGRPLAHASSVDFSPDAAQLAAKNTSGDILIMDLPDLTERARFSGAGFGEGCGLLFASDGEQFVEATWSGLLSVRDLRTGTVTWQDTGDDIYELAATRDRRLFVYTRSDSVKVCQRVFLRSWPFDDTPEPLGGFPDVHALAISDDGNRVAVAADALLLAHTNASTATALDAQLTVRDQGPMPYPSDAQFAPGGDLIAFGDWSTGLVLAWPPQTGK